MREIKFRGWHEKLNRMIYNLLETSTKIRSY